VLFDLRSRGRRRFVQVIYLGLAVLIAAGLVLFGVGTGGSGGGLFGAFTGGGASSSNNSYVTKQVTKAKAATKANPTQASAWAQLIRTRSSAANQGLSAAGTYNAAGLAQLRGLTQAYAQYAKLVKNQGVQVAELAAGAYGNLAQYQQSANAWQEAVQASPNYLKGLECTVMMSNAAKNTRVAALAQAQLLAKAPKASRAGLKSNIAQAKSSPAKAAAFC